MFFYIFLYLILLAVKLISVYRKGLEYFLFMVLFLLSALRGSMVGNDTIGYFNNNLRALEFDLESNDSYSFEITYQWVANVIRDYGLPSYYILFFLSFITFLFLFLGTKRHRLVLSDISFFYYALIFYFLSIHISRQMAAISIVFWAYSFLEEKGVKSLLFFFAIVMAATIHVSAFFFLVLFFLRFMPRFNIYKVSTLVSFFLFGLFFFSQFSRTYIQNSLLPYLDIIEIYDRSSLTFVEASNTTFVSFFVGLVKLVINIYVLLWLSRYRYYNLSYIFLLAIVMTIVMNVMYGNITRLQYYFQIVYLVAYSLFFSRTRLRNSQTKFLFYLFVLSSFAQVFACLRSDPYEIIPYRFNEKLF